MKNYLLLILLTIPFTLLFSQERSITIEWEKTFGDTKNDMSRAIIATAQNEIVIIGSQQVPDRYDNDLWMIKTDSDGNLIWEKTYGDEKMENGIDAIELDNGDLIVLGTTTTNAKKGE